MGISERFTVDNDITRYGGSSFIQLTDLERAGGAATHSGESTYGATLTIDLRALGDAAGNAASIPNLIFVTLYHDLIVDMSDAGVTVAM